MATANVHEIIDEASLRVTVLPKIKAVYEKNALDAKIVGNVMTCIERILDKLDKQQVCGFIFIFRLFLGITKHSLTMKCLGPLTVEK